MSAKLIPLTTIPYAARDAERRARAQHANRAAALDAAGYKIVVAPGCHGRPYFDPPVIGWVLTRVASDAIASVQTRMPGGTSHRRMAVEVQS